MNKRRSDALQALVTEFVGLSQETAVAMDAETEARQESIAARQALDTATARRAALVKRGDQTREAIAILQIRDDVSDEVVEALIDREGER